MNKLQTPLLLPTIGFIVGVVAFGAIELNIIIPLIIAMVGGVLLLWRGWSVALLAVAIGVGGVRISSYGSLDNNNSQISWSDDDTHLSHINELAQQRLSELHLSPRADALVRAMILGDKSGITSTQRREYGASGASHILAVSGLHLSIIFALLNFVLMPLVLLPRGHIAKSLIIIALIWIYSGITGFSPSVIRSAIMFSLFQMAFVWGQPYRSVNALLFALLIGVGIAPEMLYSLGFQLSVVAVASIFMWGLPLYYRFFGGGGAVVASLCITLGCSVATMPIVSHTFGYIPILGIAFSPLFIVCATLIVGCGVIWILLPLGIMDSMVRFVVEATAMVMDNSSSWVASQGWGIVEWRASTLEVALIYLIYIVITLLVWSDEDK